MLEKCAGDVACILHRCGDVFAGDGAHAARRWHHVFRRDRLAACREVRDNALALLPEMQHVIEGVRADVHQAISAVVAFAAAVNIAEFADFPGVKGARNRLHRRTDSALVMHRDLHAFLLCLGDNGIRLHQIDAHRFFYLNVDTVFQHTHAQVVMKLCPGRNRDDVRCSLPNHLI